MEINCFNKTKIKTSSKLSYKQCTYVCHPLRHEFLVGHVQFAIELFRLTCFSDHSLCKCDRPQSDDVAKSIQPME